MKKNIRLIICFIMFFLQNFDLKASEAVDQCVRNAFARAKNERVAVIAIGDSNQRFGGHGWSSAMSSALSQKFGCYGTQLRLFNYSPKEDTVAPDKFNQISLGSWFLPEGKSVKPNWRNGQLIVNANHPLGITGRLLFHLWYGTIDGGASIQPTIRRDQAPWTILAKSVKPISCSAKEISLQCTTLTLESAKGRDFPVLFSVVPKNSDINGPFLGSAMMAENVDKTSGIAFHTLYAQGGQSLYDMLHTIRDKWGQERVGGFMAQIRQTLNGSKQAIVIITSGLNDLHEKSKSIGPKGGFDGSSVEAYEDHLRGLTTVLQQSWVRAGGKSEELTVVFMPSHPIANLPGKIDDMQGYRQSAINVSGESLQLGCILISQLIDQPTMANNGYYDKGSASNPHLSKKGYEAIATLMASAIDK